MYDIQIEHPSEERLKELGIENWNSWSCEPSTFDWQYQEEEVAYIQEGKVTVKHGDTDTIVQKGDLVTFPKGMKCVWVVHEPIQKVFKFNE